ncbi:hypothetical protein TRV_02734 [Trichophyton verrucosum HKI 0517]|uniref:Uncharacterized protein n=1 Tax=Trichophyton verrucosum (strain HKI 0517) TaxID=663202 RepID=D4D6K8_TRIVH|nr:uncharacterized protein TRV_02734 [Trichophyton verrucosum HKI 0517]EFE42537.1 hypothetical protein TRV_02734 [Trichophyton verrucosum HKI 0517]
MAIQVGQEKIFPPPSNSLQGKKETEKGTKMPLFVARLAPVSLTVIWDEVEKSTGWKIEVSETVRRTLYVKDISPKVNTIVTEEYVLWRVQAYIKYTETLETFYLVASHGSHLEIGYFQRKKPDIIPRLSEVFNGADRIQIMYLPAVAKLLHEMVS